MPAEKNDLALNVDIYTALLILSEQLAPPLLLVLLKISPERRRHQGQLIMRWTLHGDLEEQETELSEQPRREMNLSEPLLTVLLPSEFSRNLGSFSRLELKLGLLTDSGETGRTLGWPDESMRQGGPGLQRLARKEYQLQ